MTVTLSRMDRSSPELSPRLLSGDDIAHLLGVTPRTVRRLAETNRLPRVVLGHRTTRYRLEDVRALIDAAVVPTNDERLAGNEALEQLRPVETAGDGSAG
jgi:excisionase family DNA binding protein